MERSTTPLGQMYTAMAIADHLSLQQNFCDRPVFQELSYAELHRSYTCRQQ